MNNKHSLITHSLLKPETTTSLSMSGWDLLVRQARHANLLARLCMVLEEYQLLEQIPHGPRNHLLSARTMADRHAIAVRWEVNRIQYALRKTGIKVILLKGAAYVMAGLPAAKGRLFSDIDIMVPKEYLQPTENALLMNGWGATHPNSYDQHYYRTWMHELPPLQHLERKTVLDVHHNILPETARIHPDPAKLLSAITPVEEYDNLYTLAPVDMVLHSATHLFHDGELEHGLRDLVDLDALLCHFGKDEQFWQRLPMRAKELDLSRPLYYALRFTQNFLQTPIPDEAIDDSIAGKPNPLISPVMDALFTRGLAPDHASCNDWFTGIARWLLYMRSHYLRMPLHLLLPHLFRKAVIRKKDG